jgi:hypothetical protein
LEKSTLSYLPEEFLVGVRAIILVGYLILDKLLISDEGTGRLDFNQ